MTIMLAAFNQSLTAKMPVSVLSHQQVPDACPTTSTPRIFDRRTMRKSTLSLVALIYVLFAPVTRAQVAPEQARNFQINATHTGSVSSDHVVPPLRQRWS